MEAMNGVVRSMVLVVAPVWGEALSVLYERVSTGRVHRTAAAGACEQHRDE